MWFNLVTDTVEYSPSSSTKPDCISVERLTAQIRHDLGLKKGDSFVWQEANPRSGRVEKHFLHFDGSGLDQSHRGDLEKLIDFSVQNRLVGYELLTEFALKYSTNNYISCFRGNKSIITADPEKALRAYLAEFGRFD